MRFQDLPVRLEADSVFPIAESTLADTYGDVTIRTADGEKPLSAFLDPSADNTFSDIEGLLRHLHAAHTPSLRLRDVPTYAASFIEFPIEQERFLALFGTIEIEAPSGETGETVREAIERCSDDETYEYTDINDLSNTLFCNVGDEFIGRKYYDDRSTNVDADEESVSF